MTRVIVFIVCCWSLILLAEPALASCRTTTITTPDGRLVICTTCCTGNSCHTNCF